MKNSDTHNFTYCLVITVAELDIIKKVSLKIIVSGKMTIDTPSSGIPREAVIHFYTAKLYLPGLFQRNAFLILNLILPFVDILTDYINAGYGSRQDSQNCSHVLNKTALKQI